MPDLDDMIENELKKMRTQPRLTQLQPPAEVREGNFIERMVKAAMPSVVRDMKARRAEKQRIERAQDKQEAATPIFAPPQAGKGFDGNVQYEQSDPDFV